MEVSVIWHERKRDLPKVLSVPVGEIHLWHCKKSTKEKNNSFVEVRGIPLTFNVIFRTDHIDGGAYMNLVNGAKEFTEKDISNFFYYMKIAKKEALIKLKPYSKQ